MEVDESPKASPSSRKGGKAKSKKVTLPYKAEINHSYLKSDFKECFENAFTQTREIIHGKHGCQGISCSLLAVKVSL